VSSSAERQHPLCLDCGYDLLGTVAGGGRVCPECGVSFTLAELAEGRKEVWTPAHGCRRAVTVLTVRSLFCAPVCIGLAMLATPAFYSPPYWGVILILAIAGFGLGLVLCLNLRAHTGLAGPMLAAITAGFAWGIVIDAVAVSHFFLRPLPGWSAAYAQATVAAFATLWIVKEMILDR
jgi:hypothetical protein